MKKQKAKAKGRARLHSAKERRRRRADPSPEKPKEQSWVEEFVDGATTAAADKVIEAVVKTVVG